MFDFLKKPLIALTLVFAVLNLLDYLTTVYALMNVPNAYEMNFELANFDLMYRVKIINANITIVFFLFIATFLEKMKNYDRFIRFMYNVQFTALILVVIQYVLVVINNAYIDLAHSSLKPLSSLLKSIICFNHYHKDSNYMMTILGYYIQHRFVDIIITKAINFIHNNYY